MSNEGAESARPVFYRFLTDPYAGIRSHSTIESQTHRKGDVVGPYPATHLKSLGIMYAALGSGFPRGAPPDRIVYKHKPNFPLRDFESWASTWIISDAARLVLERYAAGMIDLASSEVFVREKDRDIPAGPRWQMDVIRFFDAVDESVSKIAWMVGKPQYDLVGSKYIFKTDLPVDLHLFRIWKEPSVVACSQVLRDAITEAKLSGVAFEAF